MPVDKFVCPNGDKIPIEQCLSLCPHHVRCMSHPTLLSVANSVKDRNLGRKYSVTELLSGTREIFLKKQPDCSYAVDPSSQIFATFGTALHSICEENSSPFSLSELRFSNDLYTGQIDAYGDLLGNGKKVLIDFKSTSSFKAALSLGYYKVDVPTGEYYKTGARKGQAKTKRVFRTDGVKHLSQWAIQINAYRLLLEEHNFPVEEMWIQMFVRDYSLKTAAERNITKPIYLIKINKISDIWIRRYFAAKKKRLDEAIDNNILPPFCRSAECWNGRKCEGYCDVADTCKKEYEEQLSEQTSNETAA